MADQIANSDKFAISVKVTSIEKPQDVKKDTNYSCSIFIETTHGQWTLNRSIKDFEIFHANLVINDSFRGVNFPKLPARKGNVPSGIEEYLKTKQQEYTIYLSEILHRSVLLGNKDILDFIQSPEKVRRAAKKLKEFESIPVKSGVMKKEGEKWKGYRSRFFVLLPSYLLQYFENVDGYQIGLTAKGCIDLTLATKILVYDKTSNPYSMGIKCPNRVWKLQCDTESERDEWVQSLRNLLQNPNHTGYIADFYENQNKENGKSSPKSVSVEQNSKKEDEAMNTKNLEMGDQDSQIMELQDRMKSLIDKQNVDREHLKDEIAVEYKQQLDLQRETMVKWKEKIQELSEEIVNIEQQRRDADNEHKEQINSLNEEIEKYKKMNAEQTKELEEKTQIITKTQTDMKEMNVIIAKLQATAEERRKRMFSIQDLLFKVQGDSVGKLKYNKSSQKMVVFVNKINHLFYYDAKDNKSDQQKFIVIKDVSIKNEQIEKGMKKPWFFVIGEKRSALFGAESKDVRDKWVKFIKESLGKDKNVNDDGDQDDKKDDQ